MDCKKCGRQINQNEKQGIDGNNQVRHQRCMPKKNYSGPTPAQAKRERKKGRVK